MNDLFINEEGIFCLILKEKMLNRLFFLVALLFAVESYALELSSEDRIVMERFFRHMLKESEGGYVLDGKKPVCINGFMIKDYFLQENDHHKEFIYLREGALKWKNINIMDPAQNIIIHVFHQEDSLVKNCIHILFINKKLFIDTVESNLSLFQYVLGPDITPSKLLDKLTNPEETFHSVLKNDKVLIGILLGYGVQNSLYASRVENIYDNLFLKEQPPHRSQVSKLGDVKVEFKQMLLLKSSPSSHISIVQPSFGFTSIKEETKSIFDKMDISSSKLAKNTPPFIFGRLKEDKETDKLVSELEASQLKINQMLESENFLSDVLSIIFPNEKINISQEQKQYLHFDESEIKQLPFLVAANIWRILEDEDESYQNFFVKGMKDADIDIEYIGPFANTFRYEKLTAYSTIRQNLQASDEYFQHLEKNQSNIPISPLKLYYRVIEEGTGEPLTDQTQAAINYTIKTPNNAILVNTWMGERPEYVDLCETIPGFAWGIKGMKRGEIREIYIHPSLGYGIYTTLDKGIYLKAFVQLIDMKMDREKFPELTFLDLEMDVSPNFNAEYQAEKEKVAYESGLTIWQHYKKSHLYTYSEVLDWINQFKAGKSANIDSEYHQKLINRLHWNIYKEGDISSSGSKL